MLRQLWLIVRFFVFGAFSGALYDAVRILRVFAFACDYSGSKAAIGSLSRLTDRLKGSVSSESGKMAGLGKCCRTAVVVITDVVYSSVVGIAFIIFLYHENYCILRSYLLLGAALGFAAYYFTVGRVVITFADTVRALLTALMRVIYKPIKSLFRLAAHLSRFIWQVTGGRLVLHRKIRRAKRRTADAQRHLPELVSITYYSERGGNDAQRQ